MTSVENVLAFFGQLVTWITSNGSTIVQFITNNAIILVPMFLFFVIGGTIGLVKRLIRG